MSKKLILLTMVVVVGCLSVLRLFEQINTGQVIEIIVLTTLVLLTAVYVKELREQRLSEAQPYLLLRLAHEVLQWDKTEQGEQPAREFPVTIRNVGKGPAMNLWAALWGPEKTYFGDSKDYLAPGEEWQITTTRVSTSGVELGIEKEGWLPELRKLIKQEYPGVVAVKYSDIHHRVWASYLCLERHVDIETFVIEGEQNIVELKKND